MKNPIVTDITVDMVKYFANDPRMIHHTLKVHSFSKLIAELEQIEDGRLEILELAALLHDIGVKESEKKYRSGNYHEQEGAPIAREFLEMHGISRNQIDRVCYLVGHHHGYDKIDGIDFQILVEADFLVNIYEGNIKNTTIPEIEECCFKTETGISFLKSMYGEYAF